MLAQPRIAVFAGVSLNLLDGSSIWLDSVVSVLTDVLGAHVTLISRDRVRRETIVGRFRNDDRVTIIEPAVDILPGRHAALSHADLMDILTRMDEEHALDLLIVRGRAWCHALASSPRFRSRLCSYVLDPVAGQSAGTLAELEHIIRHSRTLLVQSELQRVIYEAHFGDLREKAFVLPPMVPDRPRPAPARLAPPAGVKLVYSGKYSKLWNVESYFELPALGREAGMSIAVVMAGDKVHNEPDDPGFRDRIRARLEDTPGVSWAGALPRAQAIELAAEADFGLCVRDEGTRLSKAFHISTKLLEFCSVGVPPLVNRHEIYEGLLGADYPFYASSQADVLSCIRAAIATPALHEEARQRCFSLAQPFMFSRAGPRLRALVPC